MKTLRSGRVESNPTILVRVFSATRQALHSTLPSQARKQVTHKDRWGEALVSHLDQSAAMARVLGNTSACIARRDARAPGGAMPSHLSSQLLSSAAGPASIPTWGGSSCWSP